MLTNEISLSLSLCQSLFLSPSNSKLPDLPLLLFLSFNATRSNDSSFFPDSEVTLPWLQWPQPATRGSGNSGVSLQLITFLIFSVNQTPAVSLLKKGRMYMFVIQVCWGSNAMLVTMYGV